VLVLLAFLWDAPAPRAREPPDPIWLPGIYDNADYDDVIGLLTDTAAVCELPPVTADPSCLGFGPVLSGSASVVPTRFCSASGSALLRSSDGLRPGCASRSSTASSRHGMPRG